MKVAPQVLMVMMVKLVPEVHKAHLVVVEKRVYPENAVLWAPKELQVPKVHQVYRVPLVMMVQAVILALLANVVQQVLQVNGVPKVLLVCVVRPVIWENKDRWVLLVTMVILDLLVSKVPLVHLVHLDLLGQS